MLSPNVRFFSPHLLTHGSVATVVFTSSSLSTTSHIFNIPWKRVNWVFLWGCHSACLNRSPGCRELFSNSLFESFWPRSSLPPDYHENHLIWVDLSLKAPFELPLATAHLVQPPGPAWLSESHLIWVDWIAVFSLPFDFMQSVPLSSLWASFVGRSLFIVYALIVYYLHSATLFHSFYLIQYCLILIVHLPFFFNYCSLFWSRNVL